MKSDKITRKKFLAHASMWGLSTVAGSTWLAACSGPAGQSEQGSETTVPPSLEEESGVAKADPAGPDTEACDDLTGLTEIEVQQREQLQYVAESPKEEQICANCQFWQPNQQEESCGGCQLIKGPIHPNGWCQTWAPKQT